MRFCDASEMAYGAVTYFWTISHGHVNVSFIMSKTRLAPNKTLTIPQLELQAVVIAVRLKSKILTKVDFKVDDIYLWSDSELYSTTLRTLTEDSALMCRTELLKLSLPLTLRSGTMCQAQ